MAAAARYPLKTEKYCIQKKLWPKEGKHILAQYDDSTVVVYQAFKPSIAKYAVENQRFGGPDFSFERMSWIKTNFLWMMYRCGWASKKDQDRVLAIHISRDGFNEILSHALTAWLQKSKKIETSNICVRLQWDPDHSPTYEKLARRAIQLGLKDQILKKYATEMVVQITDITDFVHQQKKQLDESGSDELITAAETVYPVTDHNIAARINVDFYEPATLVGFS